MKEKMKEIPQPPGYLPPQLRPRWEQLAPECYAMGTLTDLDADILAKFILAENEYLRITNLVSAAIAEKDADAAGKWLTAQDKLTRQILLLGDNLGLTPESRRQRGILKK